MEVIRQLLDNARKLLRQMSSTQRASIVAMIITVASLLTLIVWIGSRDEKSLNVPLDIQVSLKDSDEYTALLRAQNITAEYDAKNQVILVPEEQKYAALIILAKENALPDDGGTSFEQALKDTQFTDTKEITQERFKLALSDEVAKMIQSMDGIKKANVIYQGGERKALFRMPFKQRASVMVETTMGKPLTRNMADAIISLVAFSRSGLSPEAVLVTDQEGRHFKAQGDDSLSGIAATAMELNNKTSLKVSNDIEECVRKIIPNSEVYAWVDTKWDMTHKQVRKHEILEGLAKDITSRKISDKSSDAPANVVGTQPNIRSNTNMSTGGSGGREIAREYNRQDKHTLMELGYADTNLVADPVIRSQTVSVVVHLPYEYTKDADGNWIIEKDAQGVDLINPETGGPMRLRTPKPKLEGDDLIALERSVAKVAGMLDGSNNMEIQIEQVLWEPQLEPDKRKEKVDRLKDFLTENVVALILMFILFSAIYFLYLQAKRSIPAEEVDLPDADALAMATGGGYSEADRMQADFENMRDQVGDFIDEDPVKAASIVRRWMSSRDGY